MGCLVLEMIAGPDIYDAYKTPASAVREICGDDRSGRGTDMPVNGVWNALRELLNLLLAQYERRAPQNPHTCFGEPGVGLTAAACHYVRP